MQPLQNPEERRVPCEINGGHEFDHDMDAMQVTGKTYMV